MTYTADTPLIGQGQATTGQITAFVAARGRALAAGYAPDGQYKAPPAELAQSIISECHRYPDHVVNHDLVTSQVAIETAGWQSRYARERNNPGGIGSINSNPDLAITFPSVAAGVRAHVAHLLVYAVGDGPWVADDPRAANVAHEGWYGIAPTLRGLNGRWAFPGTTYGQGIASGANALLETEAPTVAGDDSRFAWTPDTNEFGYPTQGTHGRNGQPIELLILHITAGTDSQAWLLGGHGSSTHYLTKRDGSPRAQHVADADAAWTPGSRAYALRSINVETEMLKVTDWTDAIMREVARTIAPIMARHNIPAVYLGRNAGPGKRGMIGHMDVPNPVPPSDPDYCGPWGGSTCHDDPGAAFDWRTFTGYVAAELAGSQPPQPQPPADDGYYTPDNPFGHYAYRRGFKGFVLALAQARYPQDVNAAVLSIVGHPKGEEYAAADGNVYQETERALLQYNPKNSAPFDLVILPRNVEPPEAA